MRILHSLTYFWPHYSGMTVYADRLTRALVERGHQVTILTSRYDRSLPRTEVRDGVHVRRVDVGARVSKGVLMPGFAYWSLRLAADHDVVHVHLPQLEAASLAWAARRMGKAVVATYQSDLLLPPSPVNWLASRVSTLANAVSVRSAEVVTSMTRDFAEQSVFLSRYLDKLIVVRPPIEVPEVSPERVARLRAEWSVPEGSPAIGMAARLATEKGAEVLARAMPEILRRYPGARVLYVGQHKNVFGEEAYARRMAPILSELGDHWRFLGVLSPEDMAAFFRMCRLTVLPSLNSTESFGMVQIESMISGTPAVASDLPGVRFATSDTGMGMTVPPGDAGALASAILRVLERPEEFRGDPADVARRYAPARTAEQFEGIYQDILSRRKGQAT